MSLFLLLFASSVYCEMIVISMTKLICFGFWNGTSYVNFAEEYIFSGQCRATVRLLVAVSDDDCF